MITAEKIKSNWDELLDIISNKISSPRKEKLLEFYNKYSDRISMAPASHKKEYHNAFPGGYVDHILRVIRCTIKQKKLWESENADTSGFTDEEMIFSALNHDLGKMGDDDHEAYIPQTDQWRKEKLGEDYTFNTKLPFASVPDRGLFLLQSNGIPYTFNEMVAIQTHDGLYDEGNTKYLKNYLPEQKPRTCLPFILHQADLMASRIEFEMCWLSKLEKGENSQGLKKKTNKKKTTKSDEALKSTSNVKLKNGLGSILDNIK